VAVLKNALSVAKTAQNRKPSRAAERFAIIGSVPRLPRQSVWRRDCAAWREVPLRESNDIEAEIEAAMAQWGREPDYGLIVLPDPSTSESNDIEAEIEAAMAQWGREPDYGLIRLGRLEIDR
jgi:hypothetical protein